MDDGLAVRPASADDLDPVAELYLASRAAAVPLMAPVAHPADEVRRWVRGWDLEQREVWVAEVRQVLVGYVALAGDWLDSLYVAPDRQRDGVGSVLLDLVRARRPGGFALWVFESNAPARDFYAGHGLIELEHTDGSENEERSPDLRMAWLGVDPADYLDRELAVVDGELAGLTDRREALLRARERYVSETRSG